MFRSWDDQDEGFLIECRSVEVMNNEEAEIANTVVIEGMIPIQNVLKQ